MHALINGEVCEAEWAQDRGFAYGDGVFETIRVVDGELTLGQLHHDRLRAGLARLKIDWPDSVSAQFQAEAARYADSMGTGVLKMMVSRGIGGRGYAPPAQAEPKRVLLGFPLPDYPNRNYSDGISVRTCELRLGQQPALAGIKHLNRLEQVLARSEWQGTDLQEGIVMDAAGHVIEATAMNLFLVEDDSVVTPLLNNCGIAGVMRAALMDEFRARDTAVREAEVGLQRLLEADEIFLCNSVAGVWPVTLVDQQRFAIGKVARLAQQLAAEHLRFPAQVAAL